MRRQEAIPVSDPIVSPILINGKPVGRPDKNGNVIIEDEETASAFMRQSWEVYMQAYSQMPLEDRLWALLARMTPGPKFNTFLRLHSNVKWAFSMHRSPGACPGCGIALPIESHLCTSCNHDPEIRKEYHGGFKTTDEATAAIATFDATRRSEGWLIAEIVSLIRIEVLVNANKHYVRSAYDVLRLCGMEPGFDYVKAALAVANYGNMVPEETDEDVQFNNNTRAVLRWCPYDIYLQTDHWKRVRKEAIERAGHRCQLCNRHYNEATLQAHHRTYDRRGQEEPGDLTVLCVDCHGKFHKNGKVAR
jgi:hypothetical protein